MAKTNSAQVQLWARKDGDVNYTRIDLFDEEPIKLNLSVTNIIDPLATTSIYSGTFRVPNTPANNAFFKAVFNVNSVSFDASKKVSAYINDSGSFYTNGNIRLTATYSNDFEGDVQYEIVFMGETSDFASQIGGGFLSEINLSQYNHDQSYLNITDSWATNPANGVANGLFNGDVVYPLCNWGYTYSGGVPQQSTTALYTGTTGGLSGFTSLYHPLSQSQMKPSIRAKALWDAIFAETEYTYESDFLDSDFFKKLYIISEKQARAELNVQLTFSAENSNIQEWGWFVGPSTIFAPTEIYDPNGTWNPGTSIYTAQVAGSYYFNLSYYHQVRPGVYFTIQTLYMTYTVSLRDVDTGNVIASQIMTANNIGPAAYALAFFNVNLTAGQRVRFVVTPSQTYPFYNLSTLRMTSVNATCISAPEVVIMNSVMPDNIRKIDFMRSLINRFKLVFVPSRDNEKHFTITPWKDWILQGSSYDWNSFLDTSKDIKASPLFYGQNRFQVYADQEDADFPNYTYQLAYKQTYGQFNLDSDNELLTGTITVKDQFAPTPLYPIGGAISQAGSSPAALADKFLIPWMSKADFTSVQNNPIQPKLRLVFYNGLQPAPLSWYLTDDSFMSQEHQTYPLMSEYSFWPPTPSTFDLSWQNKAPLFNTDFGNPPARTSYDTFNVYWKTWYDTNFDPYSRKVEATLVLNYKNMIDLKFNNYYWIKDAWYLVNKINDYVAGQTTACRVELIKVGNDIGLSIPPSIQAGFPHALCYVTSFSESNTYCDAYCCAQNGQVSTYWTDDLILSQSSQVWQNADLTIPGNPGFYAAEDGTVFEVGQSGTIIAYYLGATCEPCSPGPGLTEFPNCCVSLAFCGACQCDGDTITLWGDGPSLDQSYYIWADSAGTEPPPSGYWYVDPASPAYAVYIVDGTSWSVGLCSTCSPPPTPGNQANAYYTPTGLPTCDVCASTSTPTTVWLNAGTWALSSQVYLDSSSITPAGAGFWNAYEELGGVIYETDSSGAIIGTVDCSACAPTYYYTGETCSSPVVSQKFYSAVPIAIGQVISSTSFPGQCWTITAVDTTGVYPADVIHPDCLSCSEGWTCICKEYTVSTPGFGPAYLSYKDCTTGSVLFQQILPGTVYNICMCEGSGQSVEGPLEINEIGSCVGNNCYVWTITLNSGSTGQVEYEECTTGLIQSLDVDAGGEYQICAVDGTVVTIFGDVNIVQGSIC